MKLTDHLLTELDLKLAEKCQAKDIPGMALVVCQNGVPIYEKYYGYRDVKRQLPVTDKTVFPAASVTKSVTALSIMLLEDQGLLSTDDLVCDWLPELKLPKSFHKNLLKIHHLLSNTGGFPGIGAVNRARAKSIQQDPDGAYMADRLSYIYEGRQIHTVLELIELMNDIDYSLLGEPGTTYNYSNEGFALLQEIIERASDQSFSEFTKTHIFNPLNMTHSTFLKSDLDRFEQVTEIYGYTKDFKAFHSPVWWDVGKIYTNGSLKTTISDLMKYLEVYRLDGTVNGQQILSKAKLRKMMTPVLQVPTGEHYGYGLKLYNHRGYSMVGHPGNIKGGSAYILLAQDLGMTIAVLMNIGEVSAENVALTAFEHLVGLPEKPLATRKDKLSNEKLNTYVGLYQSAEGRRIHVSIKNDTLLIKTRNSEFLAQASIEEDTFLSPEGTKYKFMRDSSNYIVGIFSGLRFIPKANSIIEALHVQLTS